MKRFHSYEYSTLFGPDKKHKLVVSGARVFSMITPGAAGDVPGFVRLYKADGTLLQERKILIWCSWLTTLNGVKRKFISNCLRNGI